MRALVVRVGLHRSDVGVHEDNLDAFFLKNLDRLLGLGLGLALHGGQHGVGMTLYTPTTLKPINRARLPPHNVKKMPTKKQENPSGYLFPPNNPSILWSLNYLYRRDGTSLSKQSPLKNAHKFETPCLRPAVIKLSSMSDAQPSRA